jgi:aspartate aminotransferase
VIYNLAEALLDEGDTIAFPAPYWTSYIDIAEIVNAKVELLPCPASQDYKLTPAQLDAALAKKPKVFLFNNPSNPDRHGLHQGRDRRAGRRAGRSTRTPGSSATTSTTGCCSTDWNT